MSDPGRNDSSAAASAPSPYAGQSLPFANSAQVKRHAVRDDQGASDIPPAALPLPATTSLPIDQPKPPESPQSEPMTEQVTDDPPATWPRRDAKGVPWAQNANSAPLPGERLGPRELAHKATERRVRRKADLLRELQVDGIISAACDRAGVSSAACYSWRHESSDFNDEVARAVEIGELARRGSLETEADRRAHDGVLEPVFYKGEEIAKVRKYSDGLLQFRLKRLDPAYRDRADVAVTVAVGGAVDPLQMNRAELVAYLADCRARREAIETTAETLALPDAGGVGDTVADEG